MPYCGSESISVSKSFCLHIGSRTSKIIIQKTIPRSIKELYALLDHDPLIPVIAVCDKNTEQLARKILPDKDKTVHVLPAGEEHKEWPQVETILRAAKERGLGRDGLFIGIGGGVVCDITAFAASIYMRGAKLALIPTTLLCMIDAALGGKTGIGLDGIKNLAGTFYPAGTIIIVSEVLDDLPQREWKPGIAELIKTAIIDKDPSFFNELQALTNTKEILPFMEKALLVKGRIVEKDPYETLGLESERALLNLGHSFGHALESTLGPGTISHGEAVAWGIARANELGLELGITPLSRCEAITKLLKAWGFETSRDHYRKLFGGKNQAGIKFKEALLKDKKKKAGRLMFVIPASEGAVMIEENSKVTQFLDSLIAAL